MEQRKEKGGERTSRERSQKPTVPRSPASLQRTAEWWGDQLMRGRRGGTRWLNPADSAGRPVALPTHLACLPSTLNSTELSTQRNYCSYAIISEIPLFLEITIVVTLVLWKFYSSTSHSRIRMYVKCNLRIRK